TPGGVRVPRAGGPPSAEPDHRSGEPRHVERPMLHPDIDVIGPDMRVFAPLRIGQHMAAMATAVINRLVLLQKFDGAIDAVGHGFPSGSRVAGKYPIPDRACPRITPPPPLARK